MPNVILSERLPDLAAEVRNIILSKTSEDTRVVCAGVCGSRLKGYNSPTSDYDIRAIVVRPTRDYLRINRPRDAIEKAGNVLSDGETRFDVMVWDVTKSLTLLEKSNCTVLETLAASFNPNHMLIRDTDVMDGLIAPHMRDRNRAQLAHHYLGNLAQMFGKRAGKRSEEAVNSPENAKALLQMTHMALSLMATFDDAISEKPGFLVPSALTVKELCAEHYDAIDLLFKALTLTIAENRAERGEEHVDRGVSEFLVGELRRLYGDASDDMDSFGATHGRPREPIAEDLFRQILSM